MIVLFTVCALVVLTTLKVRAMEPRISPDGRAYLNMAARRLSPAPYCWRLGYPVTVGILADRFAWDVRKTAMTAGRIGHLLLIPATVWLACAMGANFAAALGVALLVVLSPSTYAFPLVHPYIADCWGAPLAVASSALAVGGHGAWAVIPVLLLGAVKESYLAFAVAFLVVLDWHLWWVAIPGLAVHLLFRFKAPRRAPDATDQQELVSPLKYIAAKKRYGVWFAHNLNIVQAGPIPYVFAWYAPSVPFLWPVMAVAVLAWLQCHVGTDQDRLIWQSSPWLVASLAPVIPPHILIVSCVLAMWWPWYRT